MDLDAGEPAGGLGVRLPPVGPPFEAEQDQQQADHDLRVGEPGRIARRQHQHVDQCDHHPADEQDAHQPAAQECPGDPGWPLRRQRHRHQDHRQGGQEKRECQRQGDQDRGHERDGPAGNVRIRAT
jgi:hypothetical protein